MIKSKLKQNEKIWKWFFKKKNNNFKPKQVILKSKENNVLEFDNVSFSYEKKVKKECLILKNISFKVKKGNFLTILGPSGSGKSTILRLIGGFEKLPYGNGEIFLNGYNLRKISAHKREVKTIFQQLGLFPNMNVSENIAYSLVILKKPRKIIDKMVKKYLKLVNLENFGDRKIYELSGGQKQRVAIARALISEPDVLLLDEPFSSLDIKLKKELERELMKIQERTGGTFILVTHDQEQALFLSDEIIIFDSGKIIQQGTPQSIYDEPINKWVGTFIGDSNIFDAIFLEDKLVKFENKSFKCNDINFGKNKNVTIIIRPEDIKITKFNSKKAFFTGTVFNSSYKGIYWDIIVETPTRNFNVQTINYYKENTKVGISWDNDAIHVMKKENE